ncbi:SNF2 family DNA or RNA helicase [Lactobacillus colini]|uniref:SNF2 family DNA or RNA helicase n=1 Tax=Lactobacillus colini TaxID=1819254 RepID=A0ABS4MBY8_9LACO|nr:SNF2-related protein [Lactobacillus colini]MBP2057201.1 SNF2 family DNA or RNA helicase [Lactobacillus colini]
MKKWEKLFDKSSLRNGQQYFIDDKINDLDFRDENKEIFTAKVEGSRWDADYTVQGQYNHSGDVSGLYCSCPWAETGHLCKHMAAVLYGIDFKREKENASDKISIADQLNYRYQDKINNIKLNGNPLHIVRNMSFPIDDYQEAGEFGRTVYVKSYKFDIVDNEYLFKLTLAHGNIKYDIELRFDGDVIYKFVIKSAVPLKNKNAVAIVALRRFVEFFIKEDPLQATNKSAQIMINSFKNQYSQASEPIVFRGQIESSYGDLYLYFRMGTPDHMYKVQNLNTIVDHMHRGDMLRLGKFFDRAISINQMDENSKKWYQFVEDLIDTNDTLEDAGDTYRYLTVKEIPISPIIADKIDQLLRSGAFLYDSHGSKVEYQSEDSSLPIKITTNSSSKSAMVKIGYVIDYGRMDYIRGKNHYYSYKSGKWTRFNGINLDELEQAGIFQGDNLVFGPDTIQLFGRKILPKLAENDHLNIQGQEDLEKVLPPEAKLIFRLDLVDANIVLKAIVQYGENEYHLMKKSNENAIRDFDQEQAGVDLLTNIGFSNKQDNIYNMPLEDGAAVDYLLDYGLKRLKEAGTVEVTASFKRLLSNIKAKVNISLGIKLGDSTLDLSVNGDSLSPEDIQAILSAYQEKRRYFLLRNGEVRKTDSSSVKSLAAVMKKLGISLDQFVKGKMTLPAYRALYLEKQLQNRDDLAYTSNDIFDKLIKDIETGTQQTAQVPASLANILRPYQKQGFEWITTLLHYNLGALLADEMGLGKTLQIITVLLQRKEVNNLPSLIAVPASVVYNWESEIKKFAPSLKALVIDGTKQERIDRLSNIEGVDVFITSYDSLKRDIKEYQGIKFDLEVIDEAQNIKNAKTAVSKAAKVINSNYRIALTGTPIENNLSELWSIFDYLMPGFLGKYEYFKNNYERPIVKEGNQVVEKELSQIIAPFILRRLKKDVLNDLPDKNEDVIYVRMTGKQEQLYQAQAQKLLNELNNQDDQEFKKSRFQVLAAITRLRELCCDPSLLYEDYHDKSAKVTAILKLVEESLNDNHKILMFSQFRSMLDIIQDKLTKLGITTFVITGSTPKQKRQELIKEFNNLSKPAVFLISLKAGGTGINLTSADIVIHVDPWWNSAAENQATDRAHRIGQKHDVQVYKIVAKNTIEEKIIELQRNKSRLAEAVLNGENVGSSSLDREDLLKILER